MAVWCSSADVIPCIPFLDSTEAGLEDSQRSRLFLSLSDILNDQNCLCYFVQFMESVSEVALIKFWMAVENFRISAQTQTSNNKCDISTERKPKFQTSVAADALKILEKFLCTNSESCIDIPPEVHAKISLSMCRAVATEDAEIQSLVPPDCFAEAQQLVVQRLERDYLRRFLDSAFYCRYSLDILTGGDVRLADILYSESALFYFMEFLEQERARDLLDFWMTATNFRRHCAQGEASSDAMVLYEKYFSLQATNPLQMSNAVRLNVEERICCKEAATLSACFDLPIRIVERFLGECYLQRFLNSAVFYKHVSDLVAKCSQNQEVRHPRVSRTQSLTGKMHRKTNSDGGGGGSESFLRRTSSFVSMSEHRPQVAKLGSTVELRIDSRLFCNGSGSGTSERRANGLSFGRVDALGRFERDFEWEDSASGLSGCAGGGAEESAGSKLKKAVKKLVHMPEDRVQEELAWQVAEMIVKDVTDITLNGGVGSTNGGESLGRRTSGIMVVEEE